jgi:hypothetical protein
MTDDDCPGEKGHKEKIELAAREIVRRFGGNVFAALMAVAAMSASRGPRSKGGNTQAKKLNAQKQEKYGRTDVVAEMESIGRRNPDIKQAGAVKHLRDALNPDCGDRTLKRIFAGWKAKADKTKVDNS